MPPNLSHLPAALQKRIRAYWSDFQQHYFAVYPHAGEAEAQALLHIVHEAWKARAQSLRQLDSAREKQPDWFQQPRHVGMMLYVHLFSERFSGLAAHIPYLKELGVTYLHLMPLLKPRQGPNDGGYAVADYRDTDPRLGTLQELRDLAGQLRREGILLVVDVVMNHTAREHAWAQAALQGDPRYQRYYYLYDDRAMPDAWEKSLPEVFPDFAPGNFTFVPEIGKWVWTTFYDFQWDLNYANPEVFAAMLGEMYNPQNQKLTLKVFLGNV